GAARRHRRVADILRALGEARPGFGQVDGDTDLDPRALSVRWVEPVQVARLLVDDVAAAGGDVHDREVIVVGDLLDLLALRIVDEDVVLAVAIASEVELVADPVGVRVVAAAFGLRDLVHGVALAMVDPDAAVGAAAVILPLARDVALRAVGDARAVGREA